MAANSSAIYFSKLGFKVLLRSRDLRDAIYHSRCIFFVCLSRIVANETKRKAGLEYCVWIAHNLPRYSFYTPFALL